MNVILINVDFSPLYTQKIGFSSVHETEHVGENISVRT